MKKINKLLVITFGVFMLCCLNHAIAQEKKAADKDTTEAADKDTTEAAGGGDEGDVATTLIINNKDGVFSSTASFTFDVKNGLATDQEGSVSYIITTDKGQTVKTESRDVKLTKKSHSSYSFEVPSLKTGFYKLDVMINVTDYDDTTRRAFGIRPQQIQVRIHSTFKNCGRSGKGAMSLLNWLSMVVSMV